MIIFIDSSKTPFSKEQIDRLTSELSRLIKESPEVRFIVGDMPILRETIEKRRAEQLKAAFEKVMIASQARSLESLASMIGHVLKEPPLVFRAEINQDRYLAAYEKLHVMKKSSKPGKKGPPPFIKDIADRSNRRRWRS